MKITIVLEVLKNDQIINKYLQLCLILINRYNKYDLGKSILSYDGNSFHLQILFSLSWNFS